MKMTLRLTKKMAHIFPPYIDVSFTLIPETWTRDWELALLILNCDRAVWRSKELVKGMGQPEPPLIPAFFCYRLKVGKCQLVVSRLGLEPRALALKVQTADFW